MTIYYSNFDVLDESLRGVSNSTDTAHQEVQNCDQYITRIINSVIDGIYTAEAIEQQIESEIRTVQSEIDNALNAEPPLLILLPPLEAKLIMLQGKKMMISSYRNKLEQKRNELNDVQNEFNAVQAPLVSEFKYIAHLGVIFIEEYRERLNKANLALQEIDIKSAYSKSSNNDNKTGSAIENNANPSMSSYFDGTKESITNEEIQSNGMNTVSVNEAQETNMYLDSLLQNNEFFNFGGNLNTYGKTQEAMIINHATGDYTYDDPENTVRFMDCNQGKAVIKYGASGIEEEFYGTCGLESVVNICRLAGRYISEQEMVLTAVNNFLCDFGTGSPGINGATNYKQREELLRHMGLESNTVEQDVQKIADYIRNGQGVIISVDATKLYGINDGKPRPHACVPLSVTVGNNGEIKSFFICDSNTGMSHYYGADEIRRALTPNKMNVTKSIIR